MLRLLPHRHFFSKPDVVQPSERFDEKRYTDLCRKLSPDVKALLQDAETRNFRETHLAVRDTFTSLNMNQHWQGGIPPAIEQVVEKNGVSRSQNTHRALAAVALEILNQLPPAASGEEAQAQVDMSHRLLSFAAQNKTENYPLFILFPETQTGVKKRSVSTGLLTKGDTLAGFNNNTVRITSFRRNLVAVANNGAIQILELPSAKQMLAMLRHDPEAQRALDEIRPLSRSQYTLPGLGKHAGSASHTLRHLQDLADGRRKDRETRYGWTDIHTLLKEIPFNLADHVQANRLNVVFSKSGADGRNVWDAFADRPASQPRPALPAPSRPLASSKTSAPADSNLLASIISNFRAFLAPEQTN